MHEVSVRPAPPMALDRSPLKTETSLAMRLAGTLAAVALVTLIRWLIHPGLSDDMPYAAHAIAVVFAAWWGGWAMAWLALGAGAVLGSVLFLDLRSLSDVEVYRHRLFLYVSVSLMAAWLIRYAVDRITTARLALERSVRALQASERRLQMALAAGAMAAWETDLRTGITTCSEQAKALWGFRDARNEDFYAQVHPADRERLRTIWKTSADAKGEYTIEYRVNRPQGERWYLTRGRIERDESGQAQRLVGITLDLTDQRKTDETIRRSEARFRHLAESMPQIVWVANAQGHCEYINSRWQACTGQRVDQALAEGWTACIHPDDLPRISAAWGAALEHGTQLEVEGRLRQADGSYRWSAVRALPIRDDTGQIVSWYGSNTDIDELQRLTHALKEADQRKDVFLATLSHELRNPLAPLRSSLQLLKLAPDDAALLARTRGIMERQLSHLTRLVDDLLDLSRITRGTITLRPATTPVRPLVLDAVDASRPLLDARGHQFKLQLPAEDLFIHADAGRITQALSNLLNNAVRYTPQAGHIRLTVAQAGTCVEFSVEDNGLGIPADRQEAIFEMFTQIDTAGRSREGLGIGLSIVRHLVQLHGGSVRVESQGLGHGSRFVMRLPLAKPESQGPAKN